MARTLLMKKSSHFLLILDFTRKKKNLAKEWSIIFIIRHGKLAAAREEGIVRIAAWSIVI
jgi:hypothetical protein